MDVRDRKRTLRTEIRRRILAMPPDLRATEESALIGRLPELPGFRQAATVMLYASAFPEEFDTGPMLRLALESGKRLICPRVVRAEARLALCEIARIPDDFVRGALGIPEPSRELPEIDPAEVDWVLVPGLGFDRRCYRIGRGAGHYDRLLTRLRPEAPRWSLCLSSQWTAELPVEPHDRRLHGVAAADRLVTRS